MDKNVFVHESSVVDNGVSIGKGSKIWHFSHILEGAVIGENCILGQNVSVSGGTRIGNHVKVQNNVSLYGGVIVEDYVFLGPSCVFTNVTNPRSEISRKHLYEKTVLRKGASIGANATILCGITIGRYAFVAAGAVVTKDVPDYTLVMGTPAVSSGWVSRHGHRLVNKNGKGEFICPESGLRYQERNQGKTLICLDIDEEQPLPESLSIGRNTYGAYQA